MSFFKKKVPSYDPTLTYIRERWTAHPDPDVAGMRDLLRPYVQQILADSGTTDYPDASLYVEFWMRRFIAIPVQQYLEPMKTLPEYDAMEAEFDSLLRDPGVDVAGLFAWWLNLHPDLFLEGVHNQASSMAGVLTEMLTTKRAEGTKLRQEMLDLNAGG